MSCATSVEISVVLGSQMLVSILLEHAWWTLGQYLFQIQLQTTMAQAQAQALLKVLEVLEEHEQ